MEHTVVKTNSTSMSEDVRALAQSFLKAKKKFRATGLTGKNNHQNYKYAKIEDIYDAVEDGLMEYDIVIWHYASSDGIVVFLHTRLIHTLTNQYVEDCRIMESEKPGNQGKGIANTYMKKYAVLSLCAIATEDDDGEEEQRYIEKKKEQAGSPEQKKEYPKSDKTISEKQQEFLTMLLKKNPKKGVEILQRLQIDVSNIHTIRMDDFNDIVTELKQV